MPVPTARPAWYRDGVLPSFSHPWALFLLPAVPWLDWRWLKRPRPAVHWSDTSVFRTVPSNRARLARVGGAVLRGLGLTAVVLAWAGPRWPDPGTRLPVEGIAIQLIVDVSGSMAEPDFDWHGESVSRLVAVRRAFHDFVEKRPYDQLGLVLFSTHPETACPLTLDHAALRKQLDAAQPRGIPTESETNIGDALAWGLARIQSAGDRRRVLVLLSDGEHNVPAPALTPRQAGQLAAAAGVPIYAIGAIAREAEAGRESLAAVARMTGGRMFTASDADALAEACRTIDELERRPAESFLYRRYFDAYPWCGLTAVICFAVGLLLESTLWLRVP